MDGVVFYEASWGGWLQVFLHCEALLVFANRNVSARQKIWKGLGQSVCMRNSSSVGRLIENTSVIRDNLFQQKLN